MFDNIVLQHKFNCFLNKTIFFHEKTTIFMESLQGEIEEWLFS